MTFKYRIIIAVLVQYEKVNLEAYQIADLIPRERKQLKKKFGNTAITRKSNNDSWTSNGIRLDGAFLHNFRL